MRKSLNKSLTCNQFFFLHYRRAEIQNKIMKEWKSSNYLKKKGIEWNRTSIIQIFGRGSCRKASLLMQWCRKRRDCMIMKRFYFVLCTYIYNGICYCCISFGFFGLCLYLFSSIVGIHCMNCFVRLIYRNQWKKM